MWKVTIVNNPTKVIIQWLRCNPDTNGTSYTYPIAFPVQVRFIGVTRCGTITTNKTYSYGVDIKENSKVKCKIYSSNSAAATALMIGY